MKGNLAGEKKEKKAKMETLRKLIFLGILINLVTFSLCESDDLYQNYMKILEEIRENLIEKSEANVKVPVKSRRDLMAAENEYDDGDDDDGEDEQDEHFRLLFNHMRVYRDKNGLTDGNLGEKIGEQKNYFLECFCGRS